MKNQIRLYFLKIVILFLTIWVVAFLAKGSNGSILNVSII